ncbi:MAG TPA: DUF3971 domain-containing protein [Pseudolabrys sp.]|nr:DUF3971 domain-containing protein [Pseudolabrys sp.]
MERRAKHAEPHDRPDQLTLFEDEHPRHALDRRRRIARVLARRPWHRLRHAIEDVIRLRWVRRLFWGGALAAMLVALAIGGLWWRLSQGPIELDIVTPWLKSAIEDNFGGDHTVEVGGTQIERDEQGRASIRLRDIVVRDRDGTIVASAPKAEVGLSGIGLLTGRLRAESLNLVGANMSVRIERDGEVTVFAGADRRPIATAPAHGERATKPVVAIVPQGKTRSALQDIAGVLSYIDGVGATGLDGHDLRELGLKNGTLSVDDERNGKHWTFDHINASLRRPGAGGVTVRLASDNPKRPWAISAAMRPLDNGVRAVGIEARQVSIRDLLLALRVKDGEYDADLPLSASIRADIGPDGMPQLVRGEIVAGAGTVTDHIGSQDARIPIERADIRFNWDARQHALVVPFQIKAAGNQFTLRAVLRAPTEDKGIWTFALTRGDPVIDPVILAPTGPLDPQGFALNRVDVRATIDTVRDRVEIKHGDLSRSDTRALQNLGIALTGSFDYSKADPQLAFGVAGTRMPMSVLKRLWPAVVAVGPRAWVEEHVHGGVVERVVIAGNAPISTFKVDGPPTPDDGLSIDIETSGTTLRPVAGLPPIRDADLAVHVTGRTATINLGRGTVDVAPGRRLSIANGVFKVPDTHPKPAPAYANFRIDGSVPAAALLLASKPLRSNVGIKLDPDSSRGTITAQVQLDMPLARELPKGSVTYSVKAELSNFGADKLMMGERVEADNLQVAASSGGSYDIKGNVKINGMPAAIDVSKQKGEASADLQLQAKLDEHARRQLGIDFGDSVSGTIPVKLTGKIDSGGNDDPMNLEADLTSVKINDLLPGWDKPAGKPVHVTAKLTRTAKSVSFDNLSIAGSGVSVKGELDLDKSGRITAVNFPTFSLSDGDRASLKVNRGNDGMLHVIVRADVYDGRNFVKSSLGSSSTEKSKGKPTDIDLDVKIGTLIGHNGETVRGLALNLVRRGGRIRNFDLDAKIGRDAPLHGDMRLRARDNHRVVFIETDDAGALFRFTDIYPRMYGGHMWVAMDPPSQSAAPQDGILYVRNFTVRGESGLDRLVASAPGQAQDGVQFSEMRAEFTRSLGRMTVRDGVLRGPLVGITIEGQINYARNDVHLRGTFVPFYGLNNMFGQIPIVGLFLGGGSNEGLIGVTYEVVGTPGQPILRINPISAMAPGVLRKIFEFNTGRPSNPAEIPVPNQ